MHLAIIKATNQICKLLIKCIILLRVKTKIKKQQKNKKDHKECISQYLSTQVTWIVKIVLESIICSMIL
jgi:hypothetical protein